jgi:hypothetical protein
MSLADGNDPDQASDAQLAESLRTITAALDDAPACLAQDDLYNAARALYVRLGGAIDEAVPVRLARR